jgi:predicted transcriptional regulator
MSYVADSTFRIMRSLMRRVHASAPEIAENLGIPTGTVRNCLVRLRKYGWVECIARGQYGITKEGIQRLRKVEQR